MQWILSQKDPPPSSFPSQRLSSSPPSSVCLQTVELAAASEDGGQKHRAGCEAIRFTGEKVPEGC